MSHLEGFLFNLTEESIQELSLKDGGSINNVLAGVQDYCIGTAIDEDNFIFQLFYVTGKKEIEGYFLKIQFRQKDFYSLITLFCCFLDEVYEIDMLEFYNTYLHQIRTFLERSGITTITYAEYKKLESTYGDLNPTIVSAAPMEIMMFWNKKQFYSRLLDVIEMPEIKTGKQYVYLILNARNNLFKIGRSKNPLNREKTLQSEEPDLLLIKYWEADAQFEKYLHHRFQKKRLRGEWFRLSISNLLEIDKLNSTHRSA